MYKIFALSNSTELGESIANKLGVELSNLQTDIFSDGEISPAFLESVRGRHVYLVGSTNPPADNIMEMLLAIDAAKRAGAYKVHIVSPYFGYARQDKKGHVRSAIGARVVADCYEKMNADSILCVDLHAGQIEGFFSNKTPVIQIEGRDIFAPVFKKAVNQDEYLICSPDAGGVQRANKMAKRLDLGMVIIDKRRDKPNSIGSMELIGDVEGKKIIIVDDMVDTAGSLTKATTLLLEKGAIEVSACITHGVLSGVAYERIGKSNLKTLYISDTIPVKKVNDLGVPIPNNIKVITCTDVFARIIETTRENNSINETINNFYSN